MPPPPWWVWVIVAFFGAFVVAAIALFFTYNQLNNRAYIERHKPVTVGTRDRNTIVSRQAAMDACDLVVDIMFQPHFWASINSNRHNTLERVINHINHSNQPHWLVYVPLPILNVSHRTLLTRLSTSTTMSLVSNTGDEHMTDEVFRDLVADPRIVRIYVNNVPLDFAGHPKVTWVPIGYCQDEFVHTRVGGILVETNLRRLPFAHRFAKNHPSVNVLDMQPRAKLRDKQCKVICAYSNTGASRTVPTLRRDSREWLKTQPFGAVFPFMEKREYFALHEDYAFELSPFGNGLCCFRTWEALLLHTIPIVFNSPVNSEFDDLPVLIIKDFHELSEALLRDTLAKFGDYFETHDIRKELDISRWLGQAKSSP